MTRRGFALISVLWLTTALTLLIGGALAVARTASQASTNRIVLTRMEWAREACLEVLLGRYSTQTSSPEPMIRLQRVTRRLDSVDLGRSTWCEIELETPESKLNINLADGPELLAVLGSESLTAALLDWRDADDVPREDGAEAEWYQTQRRPVPRNGPLASVDELRWVRGFDSLMVRRLRRLLTTRGNGTIDITSAAPVLLRRVLHLPAESVDLIAHRQSEDPLASLDELIGLSSAPIRTDLLRRYAELIDRTRFGPGQILIRSTGRIGQSHLHTAVVVTVTVLPERLAVVRREAE